MPTSSATLSTLITSKEQEYEMRAQSLKRLAFVILSSELDQYTSYLSDIHGGCDGEGLHREWGW